MMYQYQKNRRFFAQAADDVKGLAEEELRCLGAVETSQAYRGLYFTADAETLYRVNFHSRLVNRVLAPLISFSCHSDLYLYKTAGTIPWEDFLDPSRTFAVFAAVSNSAVRHSKFAALRLKDAVVDYFSSRSGSRPSIDTKAPDVWLNLYINADKATISLDTSGGSLHRRGYRKVSVQAPMLETVAAAILRHSGWDGGTPLYDPFCGSGTLLCEAYMLAARMPPAILRESFGFERLPDFDPSPWGRVREEGAGRVIAAPKGLVAGSDISPEAVAAARRNCSVIDTGNSIEISRKDVFDIAGIHGKLIVCNPPYGVRLGADADLVSFYRRFGDFLKQRCRGSAACVYFGDPRHIKSLGLKPSWKKPLATGGLDGRLAKYELY